MNVVELRGSTGHRIDAICNQLITSRQHTSLPAPAATLYDGVVVKKELEDSDSNIESESYISYHHEHHHHAQRHLSPRTDAAAAAAAADKDKMFFSNHHSPTHSALAALTDW